MHLDQMKILLQLELVLEVIKIIQVFIIENGIKKYLKSFLKIQIDIIFQQKLLMNHLI